MELDDISLRVLRYIRSRRTKGITIQALQDRFGSDANAFLVLAFLSEGLVTVMRDRYYPVLPESNDDVLHHPEYKVYCSARGRAFLEKRRYDIWKWAVPIVISVAALIVSVIAAMR